MGIFVVIEEDWMEWGYGVGLNMDYRKFDRLFGQVKEKKALKLIKFSPLCSRVKILHLNAIHINLNTTCCGDVKNNQCGERGERKKIEVSVAKIARIAVLSIIQQFLTVSRKGGKDR